MAKRKITPLAQVLMLVDSLSPEEIATLSDYLRGKMPQTPRKSGKRKAPTQASAKCAVCGLTEFVFEHDAVNNPGYHLFRTAVKTKSVSA